MSGCCSGPSIGQLRAGEPNSTASCQVSSHCLLQGLGREAGLLVGGLRGVCSITPSTIALLGDTHARRGVGGGPAVEGGGGVVVRPWRETQVPIGGFQRPLGPQDGFGPGVLGLAW